MTTVSLSSFIRLGINANAVSSYKPFSELSDKYRKQVVFASEIIEFVKGDVVFAGHLDRNRYYFLLKGKLIFKTGILSKKTISSYDSFAKFDISPLLPESVDIKAAEAGHILSVEAIMLDTALAWMQAKELQPEIEISEMPEKDFTGALPTVKTGENENDDWMSLLLASPLFFNLPPANISTVFSLFERVRVSKGDVIIHQGEEGRFFYVLIHGAAKVVIDGKVNQSDIELSAGAYFGEGALVSGEPRSATVTMTTDGEIGKLNYADFQNLLIDPVVKFMSEEEVGRHLIKYGMRCILLDVRSADEFTHSPSPNSQNISCQALRDLIPTLDSSAYYFISPKGGKRSELAAHLLAQANLTAFVIKQQ